ncbi:hypothetical protein H7J07_06265 [Mycobacterium koreense]|uniref:Uncharacterized protein n=2 Tax=Mycolicibacillus koreensis TaxID=1069220 RepID=A0A7I7SE37_9MYCO|nr:hypothetical protein [Mycolicibacillus koreensis]MCV7247827.1 hypothetical protein [Mycolicibacillus koreensis]OSC34660.1 hypothetical protein B8W67_05240 [Mycolicibacillus koreensis]BBY54215.1 hypothetical protein MKOR_14660 [Mycolicibacillus koreensis]
MTADNLRPGRGHVPNLTRLNDARQLVATVTDLGGTVPEALSHLIAASDALTAAPKPVDPLAELLDHAAAGKLTAKKFEETASASAQAHVAAAHRNELAARAESGLVERFGKTLLDGAADEILNSLRPQFDKAAKVVTDTLRGVNFDQAHAEFVDTATPEQLSAFQKCKAATATIDRIVDLAGEFGVVGHWPLIAKPEAALVGDPLPISAKSLFTHDAAPASLEQDSQRHRDFTQAVASQRSIQPRHLGMRFSRWLVPGLELVSVAKARENLREWAEQRWDSRNVDSVKARMANPYAAEELTTETQKG